MRKVPVVGFLLCLCLLLAACGQMGQSKEKIRSLEFTVLDDSAIPKELLAQIQERKAQAFQYVFSDRDYLYICIGYGEQKTKGYSIVVDDLYLAEAGIYAQTTLLGPKNAKGETKEPSYPYIVIKTEYLEQTVVVQ